MMLLAIMDPEGTKLRKMQCLRREHALIRLAACMNSTMLFICWAKLVRQIEPIHACIDGYVRKLIIQHIHICDCIASDIQE